MVGRAAKIQEAILRAMDGRLKWYQAAGVLGIFDPQMRKLEAPLRASGL